MVTSGSDRDGCVYKLVLLEITNSVEKTFSIQCSVVVNSRNLIALIFLLIVSGNIGSLILILIVK